jgi:hypothetical protein
MESNNSDTEDAEIVIATKDWVIALGLIAKKAMLEDRLELQFMDAYAPTVEYLIRILRKGFGWMEEDRGVKDVLNKKCRFNERGRCTNKHMGDAVTCKASVRASCKHFLIRDKTTFQANYITIKKAGGIRGM